MVTISKNQSRLNFVPSRTVFHVLHLISILQFKEAGRLLLDALSKFTATQLLPYNDFVSLTVIADAFTLNPVDLRKS
ncbi:hypothetical protein CPB83DRAFT_859240 [Crepidotus variabilis]|uniref:26S proteasome regulatory subunit Rpn7 N-terminal domain-containing protein n=1 Tax=Crepidotus variabilis TaxID=179855 RepID=A0A9P6EAJ6_9AGAR|nr:hypothetical protein CPB83DRAFT_859240 [Crepidotus variabilis]